MLTLILGRAKSGKTTQLLEAVSACSLTGVASRIVIVPEQISHTTERRLSEACGDSISLYSEVLSFTRLAVRLAGLYGGGAVQALDAAGRLLNARLAMKRLAAAGQLRVFAASAAKPDFLTQIVSLVDDLKSGGLSPEAISSVAGETEGLLGEKLRELAMILGAYNASLAQGTTDPRDRTDRLIRQLKESDYAESRAFFVDGFSDFTAQEYDVLEVLLKKSASVTVTLLCDGLEEGESVFQSGREAAARLMSMAQRAGVQVQVLHAGQQRSCAPGIAHVERSLFAAVPSTYTATADEIQLVPAADKLEEVRLCAGFLKQQAMAGCRFRDMFVAVSNPQSYSGLLEEACRELGLPFYSTQKRVLPSYPCVAFLLLALEVAADGLRTETVLAYLKSGYSGLTPDEVDCVENYAVVWNIRGTKWKKAWKKHPDGYDGRMDDTVRAYLEKLNACKDQALAPLYRLRDGLHSSAKVMEQTRALYQFLVDTGLFEQISEGVKAADEAGNPGEARELAQVWETLVEALGQLVAVMGEQDETPEAYSKLVKLTLGQYEVGTIPAVLDSISFGAVSDVRGNEPKVLCILGVNDGVMPAVSAAKGLLSDQERSYLKDTFELSIGTDAETQLSREKLQLYGAFSAPTRKLYVSWHTSEGGSGVQPSSLVTGLQNMFPQCGSGGSAACGYTAERAARELLMLQGESSLEKDAAAERGLLEAEAALPEIAARIDMALDGAKPRELIVASAETKRLFGDPVSLSASKADGMAKCPLEFFLEYGMGARRRTPAAFDAKEFGTFIHRMLELSVPKMVEAGADPLSEEALATLLKEQMQIYKEERLETDELTSRDDYLFDRNFDETLLVLSDVSGELQHSEFVPKYFEQKFGRELSPMVICGALGRGEVRGTIDRADVWHTEDGDYFRIVDYKSGEKKFDFTDIYAGAGLQLLLYLFQLRSGLPKIKGEESPAGPAIPAGALYCPAKHDFVSGTEPNEKPAARSGIVLDEDAVLDAMETDGDSLYLPVKRGKDNQDFAVTREQLKLLETFVYKRMGRTVDRIVSGDFKPEPLYKGKKGSPCEYCAYTEVCQKDSDYQTAFMHAKLNAKDFWKKIGDEQDEQN